MIDDLLIRLRALLRRNSVERDLDDELRLHLDHEVEKLMRSGLDRKAAYRQARLSLGGMEQVKEECRDARGVASLGLWNKATRRNAKAWDLVSPPRMIGGSATPVAVRCGYCSAP